MKKQESVVSILVLLFFIMKVKNGYRERKIQTYSQTIIPLKQDMERYRHTVRQLTVTARDGKIQTYSQTIKPGHTPKYSV